jgi:nucleotide-binding universal stress UspA family protein
MKMKKILFPTDFSETANNAFVYALEMAKSLEAELIVLHVYDLPIVSYEGYSPYVAEIYESLELNTFENFRDYVPSLRKIAEDHQLDSIKMSHVLEQGDLIPTIKELVKKEKINLIVMGTNGASGWGETFFGSNAGAVIEKVPMLSLSVPGKAKFDGIKKICFTTRFRTKDRWALKQVLEFAKKVGATVKCLYVKTFESDIDEAKVNKWRTDFKDEPVTFIVIPSDDVKGTIYDFLSTENIDVLAMLTYKRNFLERLLNQSLTSKLSYHTEIPILALHEK